MQKQISAKLLVVLSTIFSTLLLAGSASGDTIDLMWDRHPQSQVIGYVVHVGTQSGTYTQHIDVGSTTAWYQDLSKALPRTKRAAGAMRHQRSPIPGRKARRLDSQRAFSSLAATRRAMC